MYRKVIPLVGSNAGRFLEDRTHEPERDTRASMIYDIRYVAATRTHA